MVVATLALLAGASRSLHAQIVSDDFNDGNDQGWTHYDPIGSFIGQGFASWTFPAGGYRMQTLAPSPDPQLGPGRAGSLRSEVYSNFYYSVDFVNWNDNLPQAVGILARVSTPGLGTTLGYAFTWQRGNVTSDTAGDVDISVITGEDPDEVSVSEPDSIHLTPGNSYRFVFIGRESTLEGRVYQLPETNTPVVRVTGTDFSYVSGVGGMVIYDNSDTNVCDLTFDNFFSTDVEPPRLTLLPPLPFDEYAIEWPKDAVGYRLQSAEAFGGIWTDVSLADIQDLGDRYRYFFAPTQPGFLPATFYRLFRP